jgi:hypothetical protein
MNTQKMKEKNGSIAELSQMSVVPHTFRVTGRTAECFNPLKSRQMGMAEWQTALKLSQ